MSVKSFSDGAVAIELDFEEPLGAVWWARGRETGAQSIGEMKSAFRLGRDSGLLRRIGLVGYLREPGQSVYSDAFGFGRVVRSCGEKTVVDFEDRQRTILNDYLSAQIPTVHLVRNGAREARLKPCPRG